MKSSNIRLCKAILMAGIPAFCALGFGQAAMAQAVEAPASDEVAGDDATIIVTAQRRSERLQDVPITIANFGAEQLRTSGVQSVSDIDKLASGIRFDKRTNWVVPAIRGITTPFVVAGGGSNIGVYLDGFYSPALQGSDFQLMNVESIQVLKGPQGTLFGRNTNGGAVLINTAAPTTEPQLMMEAAYGSYDAWRFQGYASIGLSDRIAVDFAGSYAKGDGYVTNIANGDDKVGAYDNLSLRVGLKADLTDNFTVIARYAHTNIDDPTNLLQVPYLLDGNRPATVTASNPAALIATRPKQISGDEIFRFRYKANIYQLKAALDLDALSITSYTQYRTDRQPEHKYSLDYTNVRLAALDIRNNNSTFTQELLVTSQPGDRLQYTFGGFYYDNKETFYVTLSFQGGPYNFTTTSGVHTKSLAAYADLTYELIDNLFLTGGLRYTHDRVEDAYYQTTVNPASRVHLPTLKGNRFTPRVVLRYEVDDRSSVYGSYAKGYKAAIYNVGGNSGVPILPESLDAFEVGFKHAERGLAFNASAYYYKYGNQQLTNGVLVNGVPLTRITNAASSRMYGVEGDIRYQVSPSFEVNASLSWSHARFRDFPNAPFFQLPNFAIGLADGSGNHMARAPDLSGNFGASYTTDLGGGKLILSGNVFHTSKIYFDSSEQLSQDGYAVVGLRAEWTDPSDRFTLAVSGKNVTDEKYYAQAASNAFGVASVWAAPATVEASVRVKLF